MSEIRVNDIIAKGGTSAPKLSYGAHVPTGMGITGAGGINVTGVVTATSYSGSGANLTGIAVTEYVDTINHTVSGLSTFAGVTKITSTTDSTSTSTGALIISGGVGIAKSLFVGNNVTIGGTITYEDVTNIDSVGMVTARTGVIVTAGRGVQITAGGLNVDAGIGTFDAGVNVGSNKAITLGTGATITSPATNVITAGTASTEVVRINANAGIILNNGLLSERVKIDSDSINTDKFIRLQDGMVHYRSSAVGAASVKPDIVSTTGINTDMGIGDTLAVTLITVAGSTSHFVSSVAIDGRTTGISTYWVGGSTPAAGGGSNVDIYTFNILKTADNTFTVVANQTLTSS